MYKNMSGIWECCETVKLQGRAAAAGGGRPACPLQLVLLQFLQNANAIEHLRRLKQLDGITQRKETKENNITQRLFYIKIKKIHINFLFNLGDCPTSQHKLLPTYLNMYNIVNGRPTKFIIVRMQCVGIAQTYCFLQLYDTLCFHEM